jgi:hypothetical protein
MAGITVGRFTFGEGMVLERYADGSAVLASLACVDLRYPIDADDVTRVEAWLRGESGGESGGEWYKRHVQACEAAAGAAKRMAESHSGARLDALAEVERLKRELADMKQERDRMTGEMKSTLDDMTAMRNGASAERDSLPDDVREDPNDWPQSIGTDTPIGTPVVVRFDDGKCKRTVTRSTPWRLSNGVWLVSVEGVRGGYSLARVRFATPADASIPEMPQGKGIRL